MLHKNLLIIGLVGAGWTALGFIGQAQTARDLFENRGPIMTWIGHILLSPYGGPIVVLSCFCVWLFVYIRDARRMRAHIEQIQLSESVPDPSGVTHPLIVLVVSVYNTGPPSIAEGYELTVRFRDGEVITPEPVMIQTFIRLASSDGHSEVVHGSDQIYLKTIDPIPTGGLARGRAIYLARGKTTKYVEERMAGATLRLNIVDGFGTKHRAVLKNLRLRREHLRFPGLSYTEPKR